LPVGLFCRGTGFEIALAREAKQPVGRIEPKAESAFFNGKTADYANANLASDSARRDVAVHIVALAQEDDAVAGWIRLVVFELVVRNDNPCSDLDMFAA
jgi:hypothetical protein